MRKTFAVILSIVLILGVLPLPGFAEETSDIPEGYTPIYTKDDLDNIRLNMTGKYILMNDIVFTDDDYANGGDFYNSGKGWVPIGTGDVPFKGTLNGNNHRITGIYINVPNENDIGLFGVVNNDAIIQNLTLNEVNITAKMNAGGIAGYSSAVIQNCSVTGSIHTNDNNSGGIVGYAIHSTITESWFNGNVTANGENAGGVTGTSVYTTISKCQSYGYISSTLNAGGITGYLNTPGAISSYFSSAIGGTANYEMCVNGASVFGKNAGGIIGKNYLGFYWTYKPYSSSPNTAYYKDFTSSYATIENCYNYGDIKGEENAAGILGYHIYSSASYCDDYQIKSVTTINSCYNVGSISLSVLPEGDETVKTTGGVVCGTGKKLTCSQYCYYLDQVLQGTDNDFGTAKSSDQLVKRSTYTDWDFDTIWSVDKYAEYPYPTLTQLVIPSFSTPCLHENTERQNASAATCTEAGYTGDLVCLDCGETIEDGTVINALGHDFINHPAQAATCVAIGWNAYQTCSRCDYTSYEESAVDPDNHVNTENVPETFSTCVTPGYTAGVYCNDCKQYISGHTEKALADHKWNNGETLREATCNQKGLVKYTCTVAGCGETKTVETGLAPDNHNYVSVVTAPTCTAQGYTTYTCARCDHTYKANYTAALGHSYTKTVTPATCTAAGYTTYSCVRGDHTYTSDYTDPIPHVDNNGDGKCDYGCGAVLVTDSPSGGSNACAYCGKVHPNTFFGRLTAFFHSIFYVFARIFGVK